MCFCTSFALISAGLVKDYQIFFFSARITEPFCSFSGNILCMSGTGTRGNARRVFGSDIFNDKKGDFSGFNSVLTGEWDCWRCVDLGWSR